MLEMRCLHPGLGDIRLAATEKPDDDVFFALSSVALALFTLELLLNIVGKRG